LAHKKLLTIAGLLASVGTIGVLGLTNVSAETNGTTDESPMSSLVGKLADKFNLNEQEVQAVFDEHKDDMHKEHRATFEERLSEAVADGKLTEDQKAKILAKLDELQSQREANHESFKDMSSEERREAMEKRREELETWAEENDIPEDYLPFAFGKGHGPGMKFRAHELKRSM
jgi:Tfp pilus assembly protein PilV